MRKLTVKRNKSFVGCLNKAKIYIEDSASKELIINNVPCRKLGNLKNNEEKTFDIGNEEAKVFVIFDKISKDIYNDCYQLPAGEEDIFLSGQNKFNLANGNSFVFDNNPTALRGAKKQSKKGLVAFIVSIIVGAVIGFTISYFMHSDPKVEPKTFDDNGMSITLTNEFSKVEVEERTNCYGSEKVAVLALKEDFSLVEGFSDYTLEQYRDLVVENNSSLSSVELKETEGLLGFEYDFYNADADKTLRYFSYVYKADDAFWMVQFATETKYVEELSPKIIEWAKSVTFE